MSSRVLPTHGVELKLASLMGQVKRPQPLHAPSKMMEHCLKIGPRFCQIKFVVMSSLMSSSSLNLKSIQHLGTHTKLLFIYVGPPNLQA